jgi:HSP20 family protein
MDPFRDMQRMQREMNRMFDDAWGKDNQMALAPDNKAWRPTCDIKETDGAVLVHAELPGVPKEQIKVDFENGVLTISGERKYEKKDEKEHFHRVERSYGSFSRSFPIGDKVDPSQIKANFKDGVLEVTVPKPPSPKTPPAQRINVH